MRKEQEMQLPLKSEGQNSIMSEVSLPKNLKDPVL